MNSSFLTLILSNFLRLLLCYALFPSVAFGQKVSVKGEDTTRFFILKTNYNCSCGKSSTLLYVKTSNKLIDSTHAIEFTLIDSTLKIHETFIVEKDTNGNYNMIYQKDDHWLSYLLFDFKAPLNKYNNFPKYSIFGVITSREKTHFLKKNQYKFHSEGSLIDSKLIYEICFDKFKNIKSFKYFNGSDSFDCK